MLNEFSDLYQDHIDAVQFVRAVGGTVSKQWIEIDSRYESFLYRQANPMSDLMDAILAGKNETELNRRYLDVLVDAVAGVNGTAANSVAGTAENVIKTEVRRRVGAQLIQAYKETATKNITVIGERFDSEYARFVELADTINPELPAEKLVGIDMEQQKAWLEAAEIAASLDKLLRALRAAVVLAGGRIGTNDAMIGLVCPTDATGMARRAVWAAWDTAGRCSRWSALAKAEIAVAAVKSRAEYKQYGRPQHVTKVINSRQYRVDAESGEKIREIGF